MVIDKAALLLHHVKEMHHHEGGHQCCSNKIGNSRCLAAETESGSLILIHSIWMLASGVIEDLTAPFMWEFPGPHAWKPGVLY